VLYVSRGNRKQGWNPYSSNIQRFSVYPSIRSPEESHLRVGDVIVVNIFDVDEKGNGIVQYGGLRITIPNAISGSRVKVKIVRIHGDTAIGHIIGVLSESSAEY